MKNLKEYIVEGIFDIEDNIDNIDKYLIKQFLKDNFEGASLCKISHKPNANGKYEVSCNNNISVKNKKITSLTNGSFIWDDVDGNFDCSGCDSLKSLEGAPEKVSASFVCRNCKSLKSLEGAPKKVDSSFNCSGCDSLTSLEGAPEKIGGFDCRNCKSLKSLEGAPKKVDWGFNCSGCDSLTSLEGAPEKVVGGFVCSDCKSLKSLEGAPKKVDGSFYCKTCLVAFTTDDVKKVSKVKGNIHI